MSWRLAAAIASLATIALLAPLATTTRGATLYWTNATGDKEWFNADNWSDPTLPGSHYPHEDDQLVVNSGAPLAHANVFTSNGGSIAIRGPSSSLSLKPLEGWAKSLFIGYYGVGTLEARDGGTVTSFDGHVGWDTGATGLATVDGAGSTWTTTGTLYVGDYGRGTLNITGGGKVVSQSGGVGHGDLAEGTVTVDGSGSAWQMASQLHLGYNGKATLNIQRGGHVTCRYGLFAAGYTGSEATITLDGAGSLLSIANETLSGGFCCGTGTLTVRNSATFTSTAWFYVASPSGGSSSVTVDGPGSQWWHTGELYVGGSHWFAGGDGCVTASNGGAISVGKVLQVWPPGRVDVRGGAMTVGTGPDPQILDVLRVYLDGELRGDGRVLGSVVADGLISPGSPLGVLSITGSYEPSQAAVLKIDLAGVSKGSYDALDAGGVASLHGTLSVGLLNAFRPAVGDTFTIISAADIEGTFDSCAGLDLGKGLWLDVTYTDTAVTLTAVPEPTTLSLILAAGLAVLCQRQLSPQAMGRAIPRRYSPAIPPKEV